MKSPQVVSCFAIKNVNYQILVPAKVDERLVGNNGAMLKIKALSSVSIEDVELSVGDADQSTAPKVSIKFHSIRDLLAFCNCNRFNE